MTPALVAVALALLTAALLAEEWHWRRRTARLAARRTVPSMRCLVCDIPVDDFRTHTALRHQPRVVGVEDHAEWATQ